MKKLLISIPTFCKMMGVGRTTAYKILLSGEVKSIKIGRRRLVVLSSAKEILAQADNGEVV